MLNFVDLKALSVVITTRLNNLKAIMNLDSQIAALLEQRDTLLKQETAGTIPELSEEVSAITGNFTRTNTEILSTIFNELLKMKVTRITPSALKEIKNHIATCSTPEGNSDEFVKTVVRFIENNMEGIRAAFLLEGADLPHLVFRTGLQIIQMRIWFEDYEHGRERNQRLNIFDQFGSDANFRYDVPMKNVISPTSR